ncbi:MAG: Ger(x)C family spore germination protein [Syntrophomonadaceae bacterium]|jgi:Ger(x)C family germination protein|nr:Ger(x)C family spore germination protein [Syntrophomonadaceae bacterium]
MKLKKTLILAFLPLATLWSGGCWDYSEIDNTAVVSVIGLDLTGQGDIKISASIIKPFPALENKSPETFVVSATGKSCSEAVRRFYLSFCKIMELPQTDTLIIGKELAQTDLSLIMDFLSRNSYLRPDLLILISETNTAEEIVSSNTLRAISLGRGLSGLLTQNQQSANIFIPVRKLDFTIYCAQAGREPAVPIISLAAQPIPGGSQESAADKSPLPVEPQKIPVLSGMALFKGRQMAGAFDDLESRGYRWLMDDLQKGGFIKIPDPLFMDKTVDLKIFEFKRKIKPAISGDKIIMEINIITSLTFISQQTDKNLLEAQMLKQIEFLAEQEISRQINACIVKSQSLQSDVLGWGWTLNRLEPEMWRQIQGQWPVMYPQTEYNITIDAKIYNSTLTAKPVKFS